MNKALLQQALDGFINHPGNYKLTKSECDKYIDLENNIRAELSKPEPSPPNNVTATAPKEIYLCVSDDPDDAKTEFHYFGVDWCEDEPLDVCVKYIRADLAGVTS